MIPDLFMSLISTVLTGALSLVPEWEFPSSWAGGAASLGSSAGSVNGIFPVVTLAVVCGALLLLRMLLFAWDLIVFVYDRIPLKFT